VRPLSAVHLKTKRLKGLSDGIKIHQLQRILACPLRQTSIWQYRYVPIKSCRVMVLHQKTLPMIMFVESGAGRHRVLFERALTFSGSEVVIVVRQKSPGTQQNACMRCCTS
jgi:hypothetical protein